MRYVKQAQCNKCVESLAPFFHEQISSKATFSYRGDDCSQAIQLTRRCCACAAIAVNKFRCEFAKELPAKLFLGFYACRAGDVG